ncbi:PTS beta-glucoside transporter subunit EIIBCA [Lachnoclostridium sp. An131]|uniref:beta-glucoside-specific PTS transporter subunit IIABC n=1 Tax=Lachnoclostridium sp. An131 TaxID=1965555 RepID=UPI000B39B565|nr:beta-glucoside-specific PTS transporter subunit IIABC [Lachnoclostridium sp. An131]OUQ25584.1 PTS beta-glucoside transporter subunit EIIBCA [Lachnoclostridium sp. An131]
MDYKKTAADILELVGGEKNVASVTNCMTRLRFVLNDAGKADVEGLKKVKGVQGVVTKNGQFQVVIGTDVSHVCDEIKKMGHFGEETQAPKEKKGIVAGFFGGLTAIFQPIIPALAGSGMIKALLALLVFVGWVDSGSQTYQIFNAFGDALFSFMPFMLAFSAAKYFGCNQYVSAALAGVLLHSSFTSLEAPILLFGFVPVTQVSYGGSVVPILLIVWAQSYIERFANKISPKSVKIFLAPLLTIIVTGCLGITILGPLGNLVGQGLAVGFNWLNDYAGWVIPFLMGTFCPFFVMTGMHYCFAPIQTIQYATLGYGTILGPGMLASNIAQGTASLVVGLKSKNKDLKQLGISAGFTGLMGITEPALYGVTLKYKRPLYAAMIGGGVAGLYAGITGIHTYSSTTAGLLALPVYIGGSGFGNVINAAITIVISMIVTAVATLLLGFDDPVEELAEETPAVEKKEEEQAPSMRIEIASPVKGTEIPLSEVKDEVFSKNIVGKGAAVIPSEGKVYSPVDGTVASVFDTKHAIGLVSEEGVEVLIHVGLDTVELGGQHFTAHVAQDDKVTKGQLLLEFDMDAIKAAGYDIVTPVVISNTDSYLDVLAADAGEINAGDMLITIVK